MARPTPTPVGPLPADTTTTKPLPSPTIPPNQPAKRPGTSGTQAALKTSRRHASEKFRQAERAEHTYRAKKRAAATRANYADAKDNFKQAREHFGLGVKLLVAVAKGWPYVLREKKEGRRLKREEKKRRKVVEMKRRLDEKLGAATGGRESQDGEGEGEGEERA
jgi:hypothetical protein